MSAPGYPSLVSAAQPTVRKVVRKAITTPAVASPPASQEQQPTLRPGTSRSASVDINAFHQQESHSQAPELHRSNTATSVASSSGGSSLLSNSSPLSPLTNFTTSSPLVSPSRLERQSSLDHAVHQDLAPPSSYFAVCTHCNRGRCIEQLKIVEHQKRIEELPFALPEMEPQALIDATKKPSNFRLQLASTW